MPTNSVKPFASQGIPTSITEGIISFPEVLSRSVSCEVLRKKEEIVSTKAGAFK